MGKQKVEVVIPAGRLWPDTPGGNQLRIDLIGVTGEQDSGKTCFLLGIAPGVHPKGHPFEGDPRTLYIGAERSATTYSGTGAKILEIVDVLAAMSKSPTPANVLGAVESLISQVPAGKYDCLAIDPISDLDAAKTDQVVAHPERFGLTKGMVERSGAGFKAEGIVWGKIKDAWKEWMLTIGQKFQCVAYSTHLRDEFRGKVPTGKREPKGKDTIWQVTTLGLWLSRDPSKSRFPSGIVFRKDRLADTFVDEKTNELIVVPLLPPRLEICTPAQIRWYVANPPNYDKLKECEKVEPDVISEIEVQRVRLATAEAEGAAATARANLLERQRELAELRGKNPVAPVAPATPPAQVQPAPAAPSSPPPPTKSDPTPTQAEVDAAKANADARIAASDQRGKDLMATQPVTDRPAGQKPPTPDERVTRFLALVKASGVDPEKLKAKMAEQGAERFTQLSPENQDALLAALQRIADGKKQSAPAPGGDDIPF